MADPSDGAAGFAPITGADSGLSSSDAVPTFAQMQGGSPATSTTDFAKQIQQARACQGKNSSTTDANCHGLANINACSRPRPFHKPGEARNIGKYATPITQDDPICVDGKPYTDPYQVPGYQPTQVYDSQGNPVRDGSNPSVPLVGPAKGVSEMGPIADKMDQDVGNPIQRYNDIKKFYPAGPWDFQRLKDDDGSIIFMKRYTSFTNVLIGYADANNSSVSLPNSETITSAGALVEDVGKMGNVYGKRKMDKDYLFIPSDNVRNIRIGRDLRRSEPGQGTSFEQWLQIQRVFPSYTPPGADNIPIK